MKTVKTIAAQGDIIIRRVDSLPAGVTPATDMAHGGHIVAHSETGHHHVAIASYTVAGGTVEPDHFVLNEMSSYLVATGDVDIVHHRPHDTHETLRLLFEGDPGGDTVWEITRQREYTPDGWRRVED